MPPVAADAALMAMFVPAAVAASPVFYRELLGTLKTIVPLVTFLNEPLIEAAQPARQAHILSDRLYADHGR